MPRGVLKTLDSRLTDCGNDGPGPFPAFAGPLRPLNRLRAWRVGGLRAAGTVESAKMPGAVIPAWTRESRRHGWQINRLDDAGLNRQPRPTRHSGNSRSPESLLLVATRRPNIKTLDSVSVRNIVATLPYSSTARNDGPGHFPAARNGGPLRARLTDCGRGGWGDYGRGGWGPGVTVEEIDCGGDGGCGCGGKGYPKLSPPPAVRLFRIGGAGGGLGPGRITRFRMRRRGGLCL